MTVLKKKHLCVMLILMLCLCGCAEDRKEASFNNGRESDDLQLPANAPDLEKCEKLSTALDMLIVYGVKYDEAIQNPDEDFWNGFISALICNSWFGPFSDENNTDVIWDNERIAAAGSLITGRELTCTCFPDGIDASQAYSPYLAWASKVNVHTKPLVEDKFEISYDMMWAPVSLTAIDGMIRVSAIVEVNQNSPLNGYSILKLDHEEVFGCIYMVIGEFDYDVAEDNGVITKCLYQMIDGIHTTTDNENLSELLNDAEKKEYAFADINGDSKDDMIIRTNEYELNFFFYTDDGILWTPSPVNSDYEIWFTEDYLIMGKGSQASEEVYVAYQIGSDGRFKQVIQLRNDQGQDRERFVYVAEQGEEKAITDEEYAYLTHYLKSKKVDLDWRKIP